MKGEILAVVSSLAGVFVLVSLISHNPWDPSLFTERGGGGPSNVTGPVGAWLSETILQMFGTASLALPVFLFVYAARRFMAKERTYLALKFVAMSTMFLSLALLMSLIGNHIYINPHGLDAGGMVGFQISVAMIRYLSDVGAYLFGFGVFLVSAMVVVPLSLFDLGLALKNKIVRFYSWFESISKQREKVANTKVKKVSMPSIPLEEKVEKSPEDAPIEFLEAERETSTPSEAQLKLFRAGSDGEYTFPAIDFLNVPPPDRRRPSQDSLKNERSVLERKLADYGVKGKVARVQPGPVVSMYEFVPAAGVKINKVMSLADDLAMSMKVERIRVTTLTGKAAIGIEIPNSEREIVYLREIVGSHEFAERRSLLTLALGKDIFGKPIVADLARMPHLLVAGATGAGKSVAINTMILSFLYKASPRDVRLVMIDPKMLELSVYRDIPHLFTPVITVPKEAAGALRKLVFEMENRYRLLAEKGVRSIDGYNAALEDGEELLPYIVVLIDELADLMLTSGREVEDSIARLAQMARAAGIHLILATQRPSVDVLTGVIKANFPARISFQVTTKVDSRTILDSNGAENLLGKGDMLLMSPGSRLLRIHGAYVDEAEIARIVECVKAQGQPDYMAFEKIVTEDEAFLPGADDEDRDELYKKAVEVVVSTGQASISYIQRRLKIGYNRAARIMELMEEDGIVGPPREAGKPREILKT